MGSDIQNDIFLKLKKNITARENQVLLLRDIVDIVAPEVIKNRLQEIKIKQVEKKAEESVIITTLEIIEAIKQEYPKAQINQLGKSNLVVDIVTNNQQKQTSLLSNNNPSNLFVFLVGLMLFIGSGMAIMHFHADVNIKRMHQEVYYLITGKKTEQPLLLNIPYSFGIACGMIVFFNDLLGYKFDSDPSPLEIEMFLYEDKVNQYAIYQADKKTKVEETDSN
ncbi:MAG: stage V sporulation protein AA [Bacillota bacterium]